jgi:hypothetical protein
MLQSMQNRGFGNGTGCPMHGGQGGNANGAGYGRGMMQNGRGMMGGGWGAQQNP